MAQAANINITSKPILYYIYRISSRYGNFTGYFLRYIFGCESFWRYAGISDADPGRYPGAPQPDGPAFQHVHGGDFGGLLFCRPIRA